MEEARSIVLISCVKSKRSFRTHAKDLYDSTLYRAQRAFAEHFADKWYIMSAKHFLLHPETEIDPYEETLKGASAEDKRKWSNTIFQQLLRDTNAHDRIIITAGEDYCRYLVPMLVARGHQVTRPVQRLTMGFIPGRLYHLIATENRLSCDDQTARLQKRRSPSLETPTPSRDAVAMRSGDHDKQLEQFYCLIKMLIETKGKFARVDDLSRADVPSRGVYFFFEADELRYSGTTPRVVRVGTHALRSGSKSSLYGRLCQHRGPNSGGGNHRGSVFRLHMGRALINRNAIGCETWAKGSSASREIIMAEHVIEKLVSDHIRKMHVAFLDISDEPGPDSLRGFIERNAIGLLAGKEAPSSDWLGRSVGNAAISRSFLWNVNHTDHQVEAGFLNRLASIILNQRGL